MVASQRQLGRYIQFKSFSGYKYFTFLTVASCSKGNNFHGFCLSKLFGEKYKHTELALKFVQKQYSS